MTLAPNSCLVMTQQTINPIDYCKEPLCSLLHFLTESNNGVDCKDNESTVVSQLEVFLTFTQILPSNSFEHYFFAFTVSNDSSHRWGGQWLHNRQHHR